MKLLFAEDERGLSEAVVDILTYHNYQVDAVYDGADALAYVRTERYDGIILDIMMPKMSGTEVLETLRKEGCATPVMLLTAKNELEDRVKGLDLGADDYLAKPFHMEELLARLRAMLRRRETFTPEVMRFGDLALDPRKCMLCCGGQSAALGKLEYQLMETLLLNHGVYLSTEELLTRVWGYETEAELGSVWVYISYLRKRLAALGSSVELRAKRGVGYTLEMKK
ncbi:MAG: response regulator transcription factor [Oscillospiraceae bacterium]|nr:response regulator transcription factor [Oscillospiraceae bacterium]